MGVVMVVVETHERSEMYNGAVRDATSLRSDTTMIRASPFCNSRVWGRTEV